MVSREKICSPLYQRRQPVRDFKGKRLSECRVLTGGKLRRGKRIYIRDVVVQQSGTTRLYLSMEIYREILVLRSIVNFC